MRRLIRCGWLCVLAIALTAVVQTGGARKAAADVAGPIRGPGDSGKCIDVAGDDTAVTSAPVQIWDCLGAADQNWTISSDGTLRSMGKCMDVEGYGTANFSKIHLWDCHGQSNQQWQIRDDGSIRNPASGRCLDLDEGNTVNGVRLQLYDCNGQGPQNWHTPGGPSGNGKLVGIAYSTWFPPTRWGGRGGCTWGQPTLGWYDSSDRAVIRQHGQWLTDAGVDFIVVDWSNNVDYPGDPGRNDLRAIEDATRQVFAEYATMARHPRIAILMGSPHREDYTNGRVQAKADQIYNAFVADPALRPLYQNYLGKPLLLDYVGTPSPFVNGPPPWNDPRFTVRHMTGFVSQQPNLLDGAVSKYGYWSWEDRGQQTYPLYNGRPEAMEVSAAVRGDPNGWVSTDKREGRANGRTFVNKWDRAVQVSPQIAFVQSFNEWTGCAATPGEEMSPEFSNDIEPSVQLGTQYLDLLRQQITRFKSAQQ